MDPSTQTTPEPNQQTPPPAPQTGALKFEASTVPTPAPFIPGQSVPPAQGGGPFRMPNAGQPPVQQEAHPNRTHNSLPIAQVRDGIVIMTEGSFRSVVLVKSIHSDLLCAHEHEGVVYGYQGVLTPLYFPIQLFFRSQQLDM